MELCWGRGSMSEAGTNHPVLLACPGMALRVIGAIAGGLLVVLGLLPLIWGFAEESTPTTGGFLFLLMLAAIGLALLVVSIKSPGRPCPQCGRSVKRGLVICPTCSYDFTLPSPRA